MTTLRDPNPKEKAYDTTLSKKKTALTKRTEHELAMIHFAGISNIADILTKRFTCIVIP